MAGCNVLKRFAAPLQLKHEFYFVLLQANLAVQEARLAVAMNDLNEAQAELDAKQAELDEVQAQYENAVREKQVSLLYLGLVLLPHYIKHFNSRTLADFA